MLLSYMRNASDKKLTKKLTVNLMGGLGNQLFQFTFGKVLQNLYQCELFFDISHPSLRTNLEGFPDICELGFLDRKQLVRQSQGVLLSKLRNLAIRVSTKDGFSERIQREVTRRILSAFLSSNFPLLGAIPRVFISNNVGFCTYNLNLAGKDEYIIGYFQSSRFFDTMILNDLETRQMFEDFVYKARKRWESLNPEQGVIMHIRRQDYTDSSFGLLSQSYYLECLKQALSVSKKQKAYVVSDETPDALVQFLMPMADRVEIIETQDMTSMEVLGLICSFGHIIGANSTLSWWAASLGSLSKENRAWFPNPWFKTGITPRNLFRLEWTLVSGNIWE